MTEIQKQFTDDWTKNWNGSIAVKISAVVFWLLLVISIILIVFLLSTLKSKLVTLQESEAAQIAYHISKITSQSDHSDSYLEQQFIKLIAKHNFIALEIKIGNKDFKVGDFYSNKEMHEQREISFYTKSKKYLSTGGYGRVKFITYSEPFKEIIKKERRELIVIVLFILMIFSLSLIWIIRRVVARPMQYLVETTQYISEGNIGARLPSGRHDEFGQLAKFFNGMLDTIEDKQIELQNTLLEAKAATVAKSQFLANMSHEIRTPLTAITGFSKTLLDNKLNPEQRKNAIYTVIRNCEHLLTIINDILDISKIEANKIDINKNHFSLFELLTDIETLTNTQVGGKKIIFLINYKLPLPVNILSDEIRLKQILINLCTNAVKFTSEGEVTLDVSFLEDENKLIFAVTDSGIGISDEQISKIFSPFTQADSSITREYGGTGLGLSISQKLADLLGGSLMVCSKKNLGSCFTVTINPGKITDDNLHYILPTPDNNMQDDETIISNHVNGEILLVEDTPDIQALIDLYLNEMGATVTIVENGQAALDIVNEQTFDLILMDMQMPIMGGIEAVQELRKRGFKTPIAMLTANAMAQFEEECITAGCDDYLVKPVEIKELKRVVDKYLKKSDPDLENIQ